MILTRVLVDNFGLFEGRSEIDVTPKPGANAPIILFAGMNGAGKTTFLEAVQLALYGRAALGNRVRQIDYELHLQNRIHRPADPAAKQDRAAVGVEFSFASAGVKHHYRILRSWTVKNGTGTTESLQVERDGKQLEDLEEKYFQDFVRELIPPGISQLFFFDGEKIQRIADDDEDLLITESIKSLLGLDLVERLKGDLQILRDRQSAQQGASDAANLKTLAETELADAQEELRLLRERSADLTTELHGCDNEIALGKQGLSRVGGQFASGRDSLIDSQARLKAELQSTEKRIRELAETALPFAFCPKLSKRLLWQLEEERKSQENHFFAERANRTLVHVRAALEEQNLTPKDWRLAEQILGKFSDEVDSAKCDTKELIHLVSVEAHFRIQACLCDTRVDELRELGAGLESTTRDLQKAQGRLKQIPEDDALRPAVDRLTQAVSDQARVAQQLGAVEEQMKTLAGRCQALSRDINKLQEKIDSSEHFAKRVELLERCRGALDIYQEKLTRAKIEQLERETTECFQRLLRKEDLVKQIGITADTCHVSLLDQAGRVLPKSSLSAGEKQMYAVAVLWGLAKTSGRQLPLIIDTPLGRLDSKHRDNLVENYFPQAAQQVIILSTDTEIDQSYYCALRPTISRSYRLDFDPVAVKTRVLDGYFWREDSLCNV